VTPFAGRAGSLKRQRASQIAGLAAVIIAAGVLIGGWTGPPLLSSWGTGMPPMRPSAALCLGALGLALLEPRRDLRFAFGLAVAAVAAAGMGFILVNFDPGIDLQLAPRVALQGSGAVSFRVASVAAIALGFAGGALALSRFERHRLAAAVLSSSAGAVAVFALLGYLTGIDTLYGSASVSSPSLPASVGLLCVAAGTILRIGPMPLLRKPRPLWQLLVMLGCAIVAPLLLYGAYAGFRFTAGQLHDVREDLAIEARTLSGNIDRYILGELDRLQALAASPSLRRGDFAEFQQQAEASLTLRQSGSIVLIDRNLRQLVNTRQPYGKTLPDTAIPEIAKKVLATGKPQVSGLFWAPVAKQLLVTIMVPVKIDGEIRYLLARSPDQHAITRLVAATELPAGWRAQALVSDAAHRIIAESDRQDLYIGKQLPRAQWHQAGSRGVFEFVDSEARPALQANARSDLTGWVTAVWAPRAVLEAPVRAQWRTLGVAAFLALTMVIASALWLGRIIARSVGHAARAAIALGEGGPLPLSGTSVAEVDTLMAELRGAAVRRQAAEDLLRENERHLFASKARLQIAMDAAQLGWWQYDPRRRVFSGDARSKDIFDVTADETPVEEITRRVHPDDAERFRAARATALDPADPKPEAIEYRVRRRDGKIRWVELHWLAYSEGVRGERAAASVVGTVADITERKEREEQVHLLMREVNHRAKNMLSVVDSIAHQTATRNPEDFIERFSERIQALSANQDLLIRSDWSGVEIADLTRAQLAHFSDLIGSRIVVDGPKLRLKPASAQAIGLALHELATNAGKYGALSTGKGRVHISWKADRDTLTMGWMERDGPPVSQPNRRGFGTIVMEAMAERSVDGAVDLDYAPSGLTWRLTCPAANALEPWEREQISDEHHSPHRSRQAEEGSAIHRSGRKDDRALFSPRRRSSRRAIQR
jgi:PAS domain S-box-containing protein